MRRTPPVPLPADGYAAVALQRKSSWSTHILCSVTAILRARATLARFDPCRVEMRIAHAFIDDHRVEGRRITFAASNRAVRVSPSPTFVMRPTRSVSPDWYLRA